MSLHRLRAPLRRVEVAGSSMAPLLLPGDRLLVVSLLRLRVGDVVALRDPRDAGRVLVKRVASLRGGTVEVLGDNAAASTDSRTFGPVPLRALLGRAVLCYHPPARRFRLRSHPFW